MRALIAFVFAVWFVGAARAQEPAQATPAPPPADLRQRLAEHLSTQKDPVAAVRARVHGLGNKPAAAKSPQAPKPPWGYAGEGSPERWGELAPENRLCAVGNRQAPIDIRDTLKVDLEPIQFDYQPGSFTVLDTGRTIQVMVPPGSSLTVRQRRYALVHFQFHRPSEMRVNGRSFDMAVHLVHKDEAGKLAVVAVLLQKSEQDQPVIQRVWNHLPLEKLQAEVVPTPLDLGELLPKARTYFTFMGSLTTPPCSEDVLWMVMREPVGISSQQLAIFARLYPMNARPLQPAAGRLIKESF